MNRSRNASILATFAAAAIAGCATVNTPPADNTQLETLLRRELDVAAVGTNVSQSARTAAVSKLADGKSQPIYRVLAQLPTTPDGNTVRTALISALESESERTLTQMAVARNLTPARARQVLSTYLDARLAPGFEMNDGTQMTVDLPGPKMGRLSFEGGLYTKFELLNDVAPVETATFSMLGNLGKDKKTLVVGRDATRAAALDAAVGNYVQTTSDAATVNSTSISYSAFRDALKTRFGLDNVSGDVRYNNGNVNGTDVFAVSLSDGRAFVSDEDFKPNLESSVATYVQQNQTRRVRLFVYGKGPDGKIYDMGIQNTPNSKEPSINLADVYALAQANQVNQLDLGAGNSFNGTRLVDTLFSLDKPARYGNTLADLSGMGVIYIDGSSVQSLLSSGKVKDKNGQPITQLVTPGTLENTVYGLFLD